MTCINSIPEGCIISVTLLPTGMGLEVPTSPGCPIYSIGNQTIDVTVSVSGVCCEGVSPLINGEVPPVAVCDGDLISVTLLGCDSSFLGVMCTQSQSLKAKYFMKQKNGKIIINKKMITHYLLYQQRKLRKLH